MRGLKGATLLLAITMLFVSLSGCGFTENTNLTTKRTEAEVLSSVGSTKEELGENHTVTEDLLQEIDDTSFTYTPHAPVQFTLKEFLDSGPKVGFLYESAEGPDKEGYPNIYLFEDGVAYGIYTWTYDRDYYYNWWGEMQKIDGYTGPMHMSNGNNYFFGWGGITWGELSKMSDDELLAYARSHKAWNSSYSLHIHTDRTGNHREYEEIVGAKDGTSNLEIRFADITDAEIYSVTYSGIRTENNNNGVFQALYFRTDGHTVITLDNIGDEGVLVD